MDSHEIRGNDNLVEADILTNLGWDVSKLNEMVSEEMFEKILAWPSQLTNGIDVRIWQPNSDGKFSTKSAWHLIKAQEPVCL